MRIALNPIFNERWGKLLARTGMSQQEAVMRTLNWLLDQDEMLQSLVLGQIPEGYKGQVAKLALEKMASASPDARRRRNAG